MHKRKVFKLVGFCAAALIINTGARGEGTQFVPEDIEVCPASANVLDPEFDSRTGRMVFSDAQQRLKIAAIRSDGRIASPLCKGTIIDSGLLLSMPGINLLNGAEWGRSENGTDIYYTKLNDQGNSTLARAWQDVSWRTEFLPNGEERGLPLPSIGPGDSQVRLLYFRQKGEDSYEILWRESTDPFNEHSFPGYVGTNSGSAPRWIPGQRAITTTLEDTNGIMQAARYFIGDEVTELLTTDEGEKDEVWMWSAPEFGNDLVFYTVVDGCCIRVYRQIENEWVVINTIRSSDFSANPNIFSPEPFTYKNRSYISMQLASAGRYSPSEIWIAAIDPANPLLRQVSDPSSPAQVRNEPEGFFNATGAYIYYSLVNRSGLSLRRAKTGL